MENEIEEESKFNEFNEPITTNNEDAHYNAQLSTLSYNNNDSNYSNNHYNTNNDNDNNNNNTVEVEEQSESQHDAMILDEMANSDNNEAKTKQKPFCRLPIAKIKNLVKMHQDAKTVLKDVYPYLGKAVELLFEDLGMKAAHIAKFNKRRTVNPEDICMCCCYYIKCYCYIY